MPHLAVPNTAPAPPRDAPGGSGRLRTPGREARPLGAQPAPALLEPAATKAADSTAFLTLTLTLTLGGGAGGTDVD